jgi:hypothetical protein
MTSAHIAFVLCLALKMIPITACIVGAVYLRSNDLDGWGWLLIIAVLISPVSIKVD